MQIKKKDQEGFTLIELLVVVVIIGILASVAVPNFMGAQDKAKNSGVQANMHNVQMSLEQYAVDHSSLFPDSDKLISALSADYLASGKLPPTPWGTQQNQAVQATASAALNKTWATGSGVAPTAVTHYGAVGYVLPPTATANDRYDLTGTGKKGDQAMTAIWIKNY